MGHRLKEFFAVAAGGVLALMSGRCSDGPSEKKAEAAVIVQPSAETPHTPAGNARAAPLPASSGDTFDIAIGDSIARGTQAAGKLGGRECPLDKPPLYFGNNPAVNMAGGTCISRPASAVLQVTKNMSAEIRDKNVYYSTGLSNETPACHHGVSPVVEKQLDALFDAGAKHVVVEGTSVIGKTYAGVPLGPMNACIENEVSKFSAAHPGFVAFAGPITHPESESHHIHPADYSRKSGVLGRAEKKLKELVQSAKPPAP